MIPFLDLKLQHASIRTEIDEAIARVIDSTQFILGEEVEAFEEAFADKVGVKYAIALNSGSSALHLAFLAAGIGPGDEVITVPMTFVASVATIGYTGARAVLVDIDPRSYTLDPNRIEAAITPRTRAIVPVHLYGQPADMDPILAIARRHGLLVIEDVAQAHLARYRDRPAGSLGEMGCFSFYPGKNLGACGEGGMVVTDNPEYARTIRILRDWGQDGKYNHVLKGYNYRMDAIHGAVLAVKLRYLEKWTRARQELAARYDRGLADSGLVLPAVMDYARHAYHIYATLTPERDRLRHELAERGIQTNIHYPTPVHLLPGYGDLGYRAGDFPVAERVAREELSLPLFPEMTEEQVDIVCQSVREILK
ncbi:DegT/DnrJ/EryC1/StrS family aminotransferase [Pannus brasiliensis CCIBt3594]|uniref:DegT/DnrJ/EryC1/StrS family aminotransferase n=1 Tax=Pannus brasiliensis CCIBt3594 TaxID=1427578 RepID=A0AAW9QXQ8_9CHRO